MKVLVCGPRNWTDADFVSRVLTKLYAESADISWEIITGDAAGVDQFAVDWAETMFQSYTVSCAQWQKYGRAAGPIRNRQMIERKPDLVVAFRYRTSWSAGTRTTVDMAKAAGIQVVEVVEGVLPCVPV